jgi:heptosyltransferase I
MPNSITPPRSLCLLRLSAIGDTCHVVPVVRALQRTWPGTRLTWIIGKVEARLMSLLPGVEFITIDKAAGWSAAAGLRHALAGRRFDVLLHMQLSVRASIASLAVRAATRIGFDRPRARELQWLVTNARIPARGNEHVLDGFQGFLDALGVARGALEWNLPLPAEAQDYAAGLIPEGRATLVVSPCSSHPARNWSVERYAAVIEHAVRRHDLAVILCGGRSALERDTCAAIERMCTVPVVNQVGRDTLPQLLALLARARVLLAPDAGPAHMATMVGTPVVGLYAATRLARTGPYLSRQWCVDRFEQAARRFRGCSGEQIPWHTKIEEPGVMDLIEVADVRERLDALLS